MCSPRRCTEAVEAQEGTLAWLQVLPDHAGVRLARGFPFPPLDTEDTGEEPLPTDALPLWAMYDATQALCWREVGRADDWLAIFEGLTARGPRRAETRLERFLLVRTANYLLGRLGRADDAAALAGRIEALAAEGPDDALSARLRAEAHVARLQAWEQGDGAPEDVSRAARELADRVDDYLRRFGEGDPEHRRIAGMLADNGAWPLFRRRDHALAIPLLRRGVEATPSSPHPYLWLSACLWATGAARADVLPLLRAAADRTPGRDVRGPLTRLPEFAALVQDPEFLAAATGR